MNRQRADLFIVSSGAAPFAEELRGAAIDHEPFVTKGGLGTGCSFSQDSWLRVENSSAVEDEVIFRCSSRATSVAEPFPKIACSEPLLDAGCAEPRLDVGCVAELLLEAGFAKPSLDVGC